MSPPQAVAECYFLDVGQGAAQVVLLPDGGALVIDCGPARNVRGLIELLKRSLQRDIEALVVTHNDEDHDGGAVDVFTHFAEQIRQVFFVSDRPRKGIRLWSLIEKQREVGRYQGAETRLERSPNWHLLYEDKGHGLLLKVLAPDLNETSRANEPNEMSGVLALECGSKSIIFAGDAAIPEWKLIRERLGRPLACDICGIPHHGGKLGEEDWLYSEALCPEYGIISVGSSNQFRTEVHPSQDTVQALVKAKVKVLCTQITPKCADDLEALRPGVFPPPWPSRADPKSDISRSGKSRNVGCAGTVVVKIGPTSVLVESYPAHQRAIDRRAKDGSLHPLCRP